MTTEIKREEGPSEDELAAAALKEASAFGTTVTPEGSIESPQPPTSGADNPIIKETGVVAGDAPVVEGPADISPDLAPVWTSTDPAPEELAASVDASAEVGVPPVSDKVSSAKKRRSGRSRGGKKKDSTAPLAEPSVTDEASTRDIASADEPSTTTLEPTPEDRAVLEAAAALSKEPSLEVVDTEDTTGEVTHPTTDEVAEPILPPAATSEPTPEDRAVLEAAATLTEETPTPVEAPVAPNRAEEIKNKIAGLQDTSMSPDMTPESRRAITTEINQLRAELETLEPRSSFLDRLARRFRGKKKELEDTASVVDTPVPGEITPSELREEDTEVVPSVVEPELPPTADAISTSEEIASAPGEDTAAEDEARYMRERDAVYVHEIISEANRGRIGVPGRAATREDVEDNLRRNGITDPAEVDRLWEMVTWTPQYPEPALEPEVGRPAPTEVDLPPVVEEEVVEEVVNRVEENLNRRRIFGQPVASFLFKGLTRSGSRLVVKEAVKGVISVSGVAGLVGGGLVGTLVVGAATGAIVASAIEYGRQVNSNLDRRMQENHPDLVGRKAKFLQKVKEARHGEVYTRVNRRALGKAALVGLITGTAGGALAENIPFIKEHLSGLKSALGRVAEATGNAIGGIAAGAAALPGVEGAGSLAGGVISGAGHLPGVEGIGSIAGGAWKGAGEIADNAEQMIGLGGAGEAAKEAAKNIKDELAQANLELADAQRQLAEAKIDLSEVHKELADTKKVLADVTKGIAPSPDAAKAAADQAAAQAAALANSQIDTVFTHLGAVGDAYNLRPGDSVVGIAEKLGKELNLNNGQVYDLARKIAMDNNISDPSFLHTTGTIDARSLPVGKVMNLKGAKDLVLTFVKK